MNQYKNMVSIKNYKGTYGAAIGDIYGSHYEFQYGPKTPKEDIRIHSDSFDDCLRLCLSIRWDADTLAAIACPIAEAYYEEIPEEYLIEAQKRLPQDIKDVLESVRKR